MNKKGQIATTMLFFGTLALVVVALFSFYIYGKSVNDAADDIYFLSSDLRLSRLQAENAFEVSAERAFLENRGSNNFMEEFRKDFEVLVLQREKGFEGKGNFYGRVRAEDYSVSELNDSYVVSVDNLFVKSQLGKSEITQRFNLSISFGK